MSTQDRRRHQLLGRNGTTGTGTTSRRPKTADVLNRNLSELKQVLARWSCALQKSAERLETQRRKLLQQRKRQREEQRRLDVRKQKESQKAERGRREALRKRARYDLTMDDILGCPEKDVAVLFGVAGHGFPCFGEACHVKQLTLSFRGWIQLPSTWKSECPPSWHKQFSHVFPTGLLASNHLVFSLSLFPSRATNWLQTSHHSHLLSNT